MASWMRLKVALGQLARSSSTTSDLAPAGGACAAIKASAQNSAERRIVYPPARWGIGGMGSELYPSGLAALSPWLGRRSWARPEVRLGNIRRACGAAEWYPMHLRIARKLPTRGWKHRGEGRGRRRGAGAHRTWRLLLLRGDRAALRLTIRRARLGDPLALARVLARARVVGRRARSLALARVDARAADLVSAHLLIGASNGRSGQQQGGRRARDEDALRAHPVSSLDRSASCRSVWGCVAWTPRRAAGFQLTHERRSERGLPSGEDGGMAKVRTTHAGSASRRRSMVLTPSSMRGARLRIRGRRWCSLALGAAGC